MSRLGATTCESRLGSDIGAGNFCLLCTFQLLLRTRLLDLRCWLWRSSPYGHFHLVHIVWFNGLISYPMYSSVILVLLCIS